MTRPHHPLYGQELTVLRGGTRFLLVRAPDGSTMRLSRGMTDADGESASEELGSNSTMTMASLRELITVADALLLRGGLNE